MSAAPRAPGAPPAQSWRRGRPGTARTAPGAARSTARARSGAGPSRRRRGRKTRSAAAASRAPNLSSRTPCPREQGPPIGERRGPSAPGGAGIWPGFWRQRGSRRGRPDGARPLLHPGPARVETEPKAWHTTTGVHWACTTGQIGGCGPGEGSLWGAPLQAASSCRSIRKHLPHSRSPQENPQQLTLIGTFPRATESPRR